MLAEHTPGPWEARNVHQRCLEIMGCPDAEDTRAVVAAVLPTDETMIRSDEQWANARLIAAAPDLLAACQAAAQYIMLCCEPSRRTRRVGRTAALEVIDNLRAAIAKADGKAPA